MTENDITATNIMPGTILELATPESNGIMASLTGKSEHIGEKYLRHRPFLVLDVTARPVRGAKTNVKGWGEAKGAWDNYENAKIVDRVSDKMMRECTIIIDILNTKMVKNRFGSDTDESALSYYLGRYSKEIAEALQIWTEQMVKAASK